MKILGKVEILVSFMTSLVAGKLATIMDSMFTAKSNYSAGFKFQNLTIRSTSLLLLPYVCYKMMILGRVEIVVILCN